MATEAEIAEKLDALLDKPKAFTVDGVSQTEQSAADLIALDKHRATKAAVDSSRMGIRIGVLRPPEH